MKKQLNYSKEHARFLKKRKNNLILVWALRIGLLGLILGLWELITALGWVDPFIMSSPSRILKTIASLYREGSLFYHIGTTLWETLAGFAIAVVLGVSIALALWWSENLRKVLEPYIVVINALPKIALGPLIIIWFGTGSKAILVMTVLVGVIVAILHMLTAFISTDQNKILLDKLQPIIYDEEGTAYLRLGKQVSDAFKPGVELKKSLNM